MLRYYNTLIGLQEIPDEVSLVINISNCPIHCKGCHAKVLWKDEGTILDTTELSKLLDFYGDNITSVCFMGGDIAPDEVNDLAMHVRQKHPGLKIGWYSGISYLTLFTDISNFDFIKLGPYKKKLGGLNSKITNQRMYKIVGSALVDVTRQFWI